ncbi:MAG: hypothetical protein ACI4RT_02255 [Candidatus Spyradenecus sp.]
MIENELTAALRAKIAEAVKDYRMPTKSGGLRAPVVYNAYLPPKRSGLNGTTGNDDDFPFVVVRPEGATSEREETEVTVSIIIGCYTQETDGHEYCLNVMARIRTALTSMENGILAGRYVLKYPLTWEMPPDQPYPQWQVSMETRWAFNTPQASF